MFDETKHFTLATDLSSQWVGGWFWQEKIRDCRVLWDGEQFITRHGNIVPAPAWFTKGLPRIRIDGGIWAGRHGFQISSNAVRFGGHHFDEPELAFTPFDLPDMVGTWDLRQTEAVRAIRGCATAKAIPFGRVCDRISTNISPNSYGGLLMELQRRGAEGAMFRHPEQDRYECGRTENLLREKLTRN